MLKPISATPQVVAHFTTISSNEGCGSLVVEFQDLSIGAPDTWLWDFGNGNTSTQKNPITIYSSPGIYDVTLKSSNNSSSDSIVAIGYVKVFANPTADLILNSAVEGCLPFNVSFSDISTVVSPITSWQWDFGDGGSSSIQNPMYTYLTEGNFSVSLLIVDGNDCQSLFIANNLINVDKEPIASFNTDITFSCNITETINFSNTSLYGTDYFWDFGDGTTSTLSNPSHLFTTGVYTVSLCAKSGVCTDTIIMTDLIEVGAVLTPDFIANTTSGCENLHVDFNDITLYSPDTWIWDFGDGNTSNAQDPSHTYLNPGIYDITLTTSRLGQCANSLTFPAFIEVFAKPNIDFSADTTYACTSPFIVQFSDNTIDAVSWDWDFGNGTNSNSMNPIASFTNYGSFDIKLRVENLNGCIKINTVNDMIKVENIIVDISSNFSNGCVPFDATFNDETNSIRPLVNWSWDFGDGILSSIQNPFHQYTSAGLFDVGLSIVNDYGCSSSTVVNNFISVDELPNIDFSASPQIACAGEDIYFLDLSSSMTAITYWEWNFGDGSTSNIQNPIYQYQLTGTYDVKLTAGVNACKETLVLSDYIEIIEPTAIFEEEYNCENPLSVDFTSLSIGADNVFWDFGDGGTSTAFNPVHIFPSRGIYNVSLKVSNTITGCTHEFIKPIKITIPIADFDYLINIGHSYDDSVGCAPHEVYLENNSQDWDYYKVLWSDGYVGYGRIDHVFNSAGVFDVSMIVTDIHLCKDTLLIENMYRVNDVTVDFGIANILGCDSMLVDFVDLTSPASYVMWDFGDGGSSILNNPEYIYYNEGFYDVTLFAESDDGCKDTLERIEYIQFQYPTADLSVVSQGICPGDDIQFTNLSDGIGISSVWDFGDGVQSVNENPIHNFTSNGVYDISLNIVDSFGCGNSLLIPNFISVTKPLANFTTTGLSSNCPPLISNFGNQSSSDVTNWNWNFNDGGISTISDPSHLFAVSGEFDVTLIVENSYGCKDTLVQLGLINISGPTGGFLLSDTLICKDDSVFFIPTIQNTENYFWDFGDGVSSIDSFPSHFYTNAGTFSPTLIIEDSSGCQLTVTTSDNIHVQSVTNDAGLDLETCEGQSVQLNGVGNSTQFSWSPVTTLSDPNIANPIASPMSDVMYYLYHTDGVCYAIDSVFVEVNNDIPNATFTTNYHCENEITEFTANSGISISNVSYNWSFGSNQQIVTNHMAVGINSVELIVLNLNNNCSDTIIQNIEVFPLPIASFTATEVCLGEQMLFSDNSSLDVVSWTYNFADGSALSTLQHPTYIYQNEGVFSPTLNVVSDKGCEDTFTLDVQVNEIPNANFLVENHCEGESNVFSDNSTISNGTIDFYNFSFGDGTPDGSNMTEYHQYNQSGTFNVVLTVASNKGCQNTIQKLTEVFALPEVDFTSSQYCFGTSTYFSDFSSSQSGLIIDWIWDFGDKIGLTGTQYPSHLYSNTGRYWVSLSAITDKGCVKEEGKTIIIVDLPTASFAADASVCLGDEVMFSDLSVGNGPAIIEWEWNLGDGTISSDQHPVHTYPYLNNFDVSLLVTSEAGCIHDTLIPAFVEVLSLPIADFGVSSLFASELNPEISFYDLSQGATILNWDFDNGITTTEPNPVIDFEYVRDYSVQLSVLNEEGCESNIVKTVHITPEYTIFIPNAFSPNGDGNNDIFQAKGNAVTEFEMIIYDRWGGIVFESTSIECGWDGLDASDKLVIDGTYLYNISLYDYNRKLWVYNGELNLFR